MSPPRLWCVIYLSNIGSFHEGVLLTLTVTSSTLVHLCLQKKLEKHFIAMTASPTIDRLNSRFLEELAEPERKAILAAATLQRFNANSVVINQGQSADYLFLLTKGRARFFSITKEGKKLILLWLPPGEIFGGRTLLPEPSSYLASTEAVKESWALRWDRDTIRGFAARYPRLLDNTLLIASEYLAVRLESYLALTRHNARQRLAHLDNGSCWAQCFRREVGGSFLAQTSFPFVSLSLATTGIKSMFLRRARATRLSAAYLLFAVALLMVPKARYSRNMLRRRQHPNK